MKKNPPQSSEQEKEKEKEKGKAWVLRPSGGCFPSKRETQWPDLLCFSQQKIAIQIKQEISKLLNVDNKYKN